MGRGEERGVEERTKDRGVEKRSREDSDEPFRLQELTCIPNYCFGFQGLTCISMEEFDIKSHLCANQLRCHHCHSQHLVQRLLSSLEKSVMHGFRAPKNLDACDVQDSIQILGALGVTCVPLLIHYVSVTVMIGIWS